MPDEDPLDTAAAIVSRYSSGGKVSKTKLIEDMKQLDGLLAGLRTVAATDTDHDQPIPADGRLSRSFLSNLATISSEEDMAEFTQPRQKPATTPGRAIALVISNPDPQILALRYHAIAKPTEFHGYLTQSEAETLVQFRDRATQVADRMQDAHLKSSGPLGADRIFSVNILSPF